jgi:hypothetical protein
MPVQLRARSEAYSSKFDPEARKVSWLKANYSHSVWVLLDSARSGKPETISFDVKMADGRSLLEHTDLLATAKELIFWIRAGGYTRIDDANRHKAYAEAVFRLCYGITARRIFSVSDLTMVHVDQICEQSAFGVDGLTGASMLARRFLDGFKTWDDLPEGLRKGSKIDHDAMIEAFHLPSNYARKELKQAAAACAARLNGEVIASVDVEKKKPITVQNIQLVTTIFDALWVLRDVIEAPALKFRPFIEGPGKKAEELGITSQRTPVPPPQLALDLMEKSTRLIVNEGAAVVAAYHELNAKRAAPDWREVGGWRDSANAVRSKVHLLMTAAFVLIATFTARRSGELKETPRDCLRGDNETGWWLKVYIEKTVRDYTWIPVPALVVKAVELVKSFQLVGAAPDQEQNFDNLFQWYDPILCRVTSPRVEEKINELAHSLGVIKHANDNGEQKTWEWETRQFRRFFAVLFFYRYRGQIETLAHHLRHFNLEITNDYVTLDPEVAQEWTREQFDFQVNIARDLVTGRTTYTGPMGDRLNRLVERVRRLYRENIAIYSETMAKIVVRTLKKQHLILTPKPWVTCTCPRSQAGCQKAACRKIAGFAERDVGPDFAAAGPAVCPNCPWALIDDDNINFIESELVAMKEGYQIENTPSIFAELQAANVLAIGTYQNRLGSGSREATNT